MSHPYPSRRTLLGLLAALPVAACSKPPPPPPPPTVLALTLAAAPGVNPDPSGAARPVMVRVYRLGTVGNFMAADFFALDQDAAGVLGRDLVAVDEVFLAPGTTEVYQREFEPGARFVGVVAAYRDIGQAAWRAFAEVPREKTTLLTADLGPAAVAIRPSPL
jgi:type VI secretion system protein VasD